MQSSSGLIRAVVDTNQLVSGVIIRKGASKLLVDAWLTDTFELLVCSAVLDEYQQVLTRSHLLQLYDVSRAEIDQFLRRIRSTARQVVPVDSVPVDVRAPKDVPFLAAAIGGDADYLVTGDNDLLTVATDSRLGRLQIVTVGEFLHELQLNS